MFFRQLTLPADQAIAVGSGGTRRGASIIPLISCCCIGAILLLIASTIVLALIPIYLPTKTMNNPSSTSTRYVTLSESPDVPANGDTSASTCNTLANALASSVGTPSDSISGSQCTFALQSSGRRRRRSSFMRRQTKRPRLVIKLLIYLNKCKSCYSNAYLNTWIGAKFDARFEYYGIRLVSLTILNIAITAPTGLSTETTTASTTTTVTGSLSG